MDRIKEFKSLAFKYLIKNWDELTPLQRQILIMETRKPKTHKSKAPVLKVRKK